MAQLSLPIDPWNPGHFYACCGLLDLFSSSNPGLRSRFLLDRNHARVGRFVLDSDEPFDLPKLLAELHCGNIEFLDGETAVKPVRFQVGARELVLDWWFDWFRDKTKDLKCWAGQVTTEKLMTELRSCLPVEEGPDTLLHTATMMKTKFGIDPRSAWSSLDVGYSPNEHGQDAATFPAVELLGAIGLQGFRPYLKKRTDVQFHLWSSWLGLVPARRAAIDPWNSLEKKSFRFQIAKRGQSYKYFTFATPMGENND